MAAEPAPVDFTSGAVRLAGIATVLLGWRTEEFWRATPAELATIFAALAPPATAAGDAALISRLKQSFPDA